MRTPCFLGCLLVFLARLAAPRSLACDPVRLVTPSAPLAVRREDSRARSFSLDLESHAPRELSLAAVLRAAPGNAPVLSLLNVSGSDASGEVFFPLLDVRFAAEPGEFQVALAPAQPPGPSAAPALRTSPKLGQQLEPGRDYFLSLSVDFAQAKGRLFFAPDAQQAPSAGAAPFRWSRLRRPPGGLRAAQSGRRNAAPESNASQLFWEFALPASDLALRHTLRVSPGCTSLAGSPRLACASLDVSDLVVFLQAARAPQLLSLLVDPPNAFAAQYLFDSTAAPEPVSPAALTRNALFPGRAQGALDLQTARPSGLDAGAALPNLRLPRLPLAGRLAVSLELSFGNWKATPALLDQVRRADPASAATAASVAQAKALSLVRVFSQTGRPLFELSLEPDASPGPAKSGFALKLAKLAAPGQSRSFEVPRDVISRVLAPAPARGAPPASAPQPLPEVAQGLRVTLALEDLPDQSLLAQLFVLRPQAGLGDQLVRAFEARFAGTALFAGPASLALLGDSAALGSVPPLERLGLARAALSESAPNLWPLLVLGPDSAQFSRCRAKCLVRPPPVPNAAQPRAPACWQCSANLVFDPRTGDCRAFCGFRTKNVRGNCLRCLFDDCSDARPPPELRFALEDGKRVARASDGALDFSGDYFREHFELFRVRDGAPDQKLGFATRPAAPGFAAEIVPDAAAPRAAALAPKALGYRLALKPGRHAVGASRTLYHRPSAFLAEPAPAAFVRSADPIHSNVKRRLPESGLVPFASLSSPLSARNRDLLADSAFAQCSFSDTALQRLALALFILVVLGNVLFVGYSLLLWNRALVFRLPTLATALCVHLNVLYQAAVFCVFYEAALPPAVESFLRHSYFYAVHWHGAFRGAALRDFAESAAFKAHYFRALVPRRLALDVVQSLFINFGVVLLLWAAVWLLAAGLLALFRRPPVLYPRDFARHFEWKHRSLLGRLTVSLALKLAVFVWVVFSVEFPFFFVYDMLLPLHQHALFDVSLAFSAVLLVGHFCGVVALLLLPAYLSEFLGAAAPAPLSLPKAPGLRDNFGIYTEPDLPAPGLSAQPPEPAGLERGSIHFRHPAYVTSRAHSKYHLLFALQGLRTRVFGVGNLGVTALAFSLYGVTVSAAYTHPRTAVTVNLVLVCAVLAYLVASAPGFFFASRLLLLLAYLVFVTAKLLLLLYVYGVFQKAGGSLACDPAKAVVGLFFAAVTLLLLGLLASLAYSTVLEKRFSGLLAGAGRVISLAKEPACLLPDDDKSLMEPPLQAQAKRPSQIIREFRSSRPA